MVSPLAFILIPLSWLFLWPLVDWILHRQSPHQTIITTLALSTGGLALLLFWIGLLPGRWLTVWTVALILIAGLGIGMALNRTWLSPVRWRESIQQAWKQLATLDFDSLLLLAILIVLAIMLIHALYYPFVGDDTLSRYGLHAKLIFLANRLPETVWGYPPLVPLNFAVTWLAAGQVNDHLARVFSVMMAAGALGATTLLGHEIGGKRAGALAAAILALTTMFIRNTTLDYTDIPTSLPGTLAAFYALRWWKSGSATEAWLAGGMAGLAIFTKQSALTWLPSLAMIPILWLLATRTETVAQRSKRFLLGMGGMLLPSLVIAAPWYVRNALIGGMENVIPVAGLYHLLEERTGWLGVIPAAAWPYDFNEFLVPLYGLGWIVGLLFAVFQGVQALRGKLIEPPADLIIGLIAVPYWLVWWVQFSFEARFLLLILPLMAFWAARPLHALLIFAGGRLRSPEWLWRIGTAAMLAGLILWAAEDRLGGVYYAITRPFASEEERLRRVNGNVYDMAVYIRTHYAPEHVRIMAMDGRLPYFLPEYTILVTYPRTLDQLEGFDLLVHSSSFTTIYQRLEWNDESLYQNVWHSGIFETMYETDDGVHIMLIHRITVPPRKRDNDLIPRTEDAPP